MPIYEYGCYDCRKRVSVFFRSVARAQSQEAECPNCGSKNLKRLMSRVSTVRSEESRMESLADPGNLSALESGDPRELARLMRRMESEMGDEIGEELGGEFEEVVGRLEAGEDPESIEASMDGGGSGGGGGSSYPDWNPG